MGLTTLCGRLARVLAAVGLGFMSLHAAAVGDWENGDSKYHSICTNCHNTDPNQDAPVPGGTYPAPALNGGNSQTQLQFFINHNYMSGPAAGMTAVAPLKTGSDMTINSIVSDISAYLGNLSYPTAAVSPTSANFGSVLTTATTTQTITVTNNGRGPLHISNVTITDNTNFSVNFSNCTAAVSNGGNHCNIVLTFRPQSGGSKSTNLTVFHDALGGSTTVGSYQGTGAVPTPGFSISPANQTLTTRVGTSINGLVTITNPVSATANLVLSGISFSASQYVRAASSTCTSSTSLAPNASCSLVVTFTPTAAGAQNGSVTITHNAAGSPSSVTFTGTGTQSTIVASPTSLAFGSVQQGVGKALPLTITNSGTATLNFSASPTASAALSGPGASDYAVTGTCNTATPLAASGGSCSLTVTFTPSTVAARNATLTLSSDAGNNPLTVALGGSGVTLPEPVLTPPASDFPDTVINETSAQTRIVTIRNDRTRNIVYSVADATDFKIGTESCAGRIVAGGGTCTIAIQFKPLFGSGAGRRTATLPFTFTGTLGDPDPGSVNVSVAGNALLPLAQSTTSINAAAVVGSPTTSSMLLTNQATSTINLATLLFSGTAASDYSLDASNTCTPGSALLASSSCTLVVRFNPAAAGTRNATLTITHSAAGSPQTVAYLGTATPAPQGRIELSATSLTYADTQLASTSAQNVTVHNGGNLALNFSGFTFGGAMPGDFQRSGSCNVGTPLPIGGDCTLTVTFAPLALGTRAATLSISSDASNGTAVLTLSGNGVPIPAPQVALTPSTLDFGNQSVGGLYPSRRIHLANSGTANLAVASIAVAGAGFVDASAAPCPAVLAPNAGCDIDIAFAAATATAYTGTLTVVSNAATSPNASVLKGTGIAAVLPVLVWSPAVTTLDFGPVSAGSVSAAQTVTVLNQGPGGVNLTLLNAVGGDAASFSVVGGTCALNVTLFEGNSCTVNVQFAPGSSGTKTASVQIASTGSFPPVLSLTGVGLAGPNPNLSLSAMALAFDSTRVGSTSLPSTVRLVSSGSGVVTVSAMTASGPFTIQSTTCPAMPFTLPAGTDCTVSVSFQPNGSGGAVGTLTVTTDAAPTTRQIALSGSGEASADVGGGGCTIAAAGSPFDPALWLMVLLAAAWMARRQWQARRRNSTRAMARESARASTRDAGRRG